ncbi:MAG: peptide deformylase [Paludibacteraceae bacterium]|nr:peptide deformylase [Paludibacteraceae bacterium]
MIYPIVVYGSPVLRQETVEIDRSYPELSKLIEDMFDTMYNADGIGLAAPQIGLSIRLFVIDADALAEDFPECKGFKKAFINPQIIEESDDLESYSEGCLSLPGISETVKRPSKIRIKYLNENFELCEDVYEHFQARVVQHEYDHLQGHVFIDHISPIRRQMNKSKLSNMAKGKVRCHYRVKLQK